MLLVSIAITEGWPENWASPFGQRWKKIKKERKREKEENLNAMVPTQHSDTLQNRQQGSWAKLGKFSARKGYFEINVGSCSIITVYLWAVPPQNRLCMCLAIVWGTKSSAHHPNERTSTEKIDMSASAVAQQPLEAVVRLKTFRVLMFLVCALGGIL